MEKGRWNRVDELKKYSQEKSLSEGKKEKKEKNRIYYVSDIVELILEKKCFY